MRYALLVEYHGKFFSGWQVQPGHRTVQGEIERALKIILKKEIRISAAGRTDAGVHATGQVASFNYESGPKPLNLLFSLNGVLPKDISILSIALVSDEFHPRYSAKRKVYEYRVLNRHARASVFADTVCHFHFPLDLDKIQKGIEYLNGVKDFSAFKASDNECKGEVRDIEITIERGESSLYIFTFRGRAFYKNMIRIIMGTLLRLGRRDLDIERFKDIVMSRDRRRAFETAPACGLILRRVIYEPDINWEY